MECLLRWLRRLPLLPPLAGQAFDRVPHKIASLVLSFVKVTVAPPRANAGRAITLPHLRGGDGSRSAGNPPRANVPSRGTGSKPRAEVARACPLVAQASPPVSRGRSGLTPTEARSDDRHVPCPCARRRAGQPVNHGQDAHATSAGEDACATSRVMLLGSGGFLLARLPGASRGARERRSEMMSVFRCGSRRAVRHEVRAPGDHACPPAR